MLIRNRWFAWVLLVIAPLYLFLGWNADIGESGTDGPAYLMMAEHYAGQGIAGPAHDLAATTSRFPPVYPLLLALAGGATDLLHAHLLTVACLLAALAALYALLLINELTATVSALLVLAFALAPGSWLLALILQSEYLYLLWSLLALALMTAGERRQRAEWFHLAALAVALAALTRTVGVILLLPLLISLRWQPRPQALLSVAIAILPLLAWKLLHHSRLGYDQAIAGLYRESGLGGFLQRLPDQWQALRDGIEQNLVRQPALKPLADLIGIIGAVAALIRLRQLKPDACYLLLYTGVILLWPFPEEGRRFTWVILPLLLAQPLLLVVESPLFLGGLRRDHEPRQSLPLPPGEADAKHRVRGSHNDSEFPSPRPLSRRERGSGNTGLLESGWISRRRSVYIGELWLLCLAAMVVPATAHNIGRWRDAGREDFAEGRHYALWYEMDATGVRRDIERDLAFRGAMQAIPEAVPENECLITTRPDIVVYYSRRVSLLPPAEALPEPAFRKAMQQLGCRYVFGLFGVNALYPTPLYPVGRVAAWSDPVFVSSLPGAAPGSVEDVAALVRLK